MKIKREKLFECPTCGKDMGHDGMVKWLRQKGFKNMAKALNSLRDRTKSAKRTKHN